MQVDQSNTSQSNTSNIASTQPLLGDRFRAVAEASSDLLWMTTPDGIMHEDSPTWRAFTGQGVPDQDGRTWLDAVHPDDREQLEATRLQGLATGLVYEVECHIRRFDGIFRVIQVRGVPVRGSDGRMVEWISIGTDITEQKQVQANLQRQAQLLQVQAELIALAHDAILICDPENRVVAWNPGAQLLYGWTAQEVVGQVTHTLLATQFPESREAVDCALAQAGHWEGQLIHTDRMGEKVIVDSRQVLVRDQTGQPSAILEINRDMTKWERLLSERAEAQAAEMALRESSRHMHEFLGIASHELRTPLTTIKATIQITRRQLIRLLTSPEISEPATGNLLPTILDFLDRAERQVNVQNRLVGDLIDLSRIQTNQLTVQLKCVDLATIVHEVVEDQRILIPRRTIQWGTSVLQAEVLADADRVSQVVNNYLTNALKYSEADKPVTVHLEPLGSMVRVSVQDRGPGLTPAEQKRIWECFYRVDSIKIKSGTGVGLGLGLHISRSLIERQGGQVGVESEKGKGSTFWFTLPLAPAQPLNLVKYLETVPYRHR